MDWQLEKSPVRQFTWVRRLQPGPDDVGYDDDDGEKKWRLSIQLISPPPSLLIPSALIVVIDDQDDDFYK